jgi:hypothetical protein
MDQWEYVTISIVYAKKHKDWVLEYVEHPPLVGLDEILATYGDEGWELVSLQPDRQEAAPGFGKWYIDTVAYRAAFKRPKSG